MGRKIYRAKVETLRASPSQPDAKTPAITLLQELIERVTVRPDGKGYVIELTGDILKLINLLQQWLQDVSKGAGTGRRFKDNDLPLAKMGSDALCR